MDLTQRCHQNGRWHVNWGSHSQDSSPCPAGARLGSFLGLASWPWSYLVRYDMRGLSVNFCFYTCSRGPEEEGDKLTWLTSKCPVPKPLYDHSLMTNTGSGCWRLQLAYHGHHGLVGIVPD